MDTFTYTIPTGTRVRFSPQQPVPRKPVLNTTATTTTREHVFAGTHKVADPLGVGGRILSYIDGEFGDGCWYGFRLFGDQWGRCVGGVLFVAEKYVEKRRAA